ncbi:MAG TPA: hypothetical protein DEO40_01080 [Treponema sp.]|nr:hypothetical protein [Treponema sp.]
MFSLQVIAIMKKAQKKGADQKVRRVASFRTRFGIYALYLAQMLKQVQHDNPFESAPFFPYKSAGIKK